MTVCHSNPIRFMTYGFLNLFMNLLKHQRFGCADFQWRDRNLSGFIKKISSLCEQKSHGFGMTFVFVRTIHLKSFHATAQDSL